jgi:hypothetical protein
MRQRRLAAGRASAFARARGAARRRSLLADAIAHTSSMAGFPGRTGVRLTLSLNGNTFALADAPAASAFANTGRLYQRWTSAKT